VIGSRYSIRGLPQLGSNPLKMFYHEELRRMLYYLLVKQDTDEERGREAEDVSTMLLLDGTRIGGMQELWMNVVNSPGILHFDESTTGQRSFLKTRWRGSGDIAHAINLAVSRPVVR
jgi:hypothetical protein